MELAHNLHVLLFVDDSVFCYYNNEKLLDLNNHQDTFLFHKCCKVLEQLSIHKPKNKNIYKSNINIVTQDAFIKFVLNATTTLKWFQSDLTKENMDILKLEQP